MILGWQCGETRGWTVPGGKRIVGFVIVGFMEGGGRRKPWPLHRRKVGVTECAVEIGLEGG